MVGVHAASFMEMRLSLGNTVPEEKQVDFQKNQSCDLHCEGVKGLMVNHFLARVFISPFEALVHH
jgi:hypothetical protein